jgi:hypothetical protein
MSGCSPLMRKYCCIIGVCSNCLSFKTFSRLWPGPAAGFHARGGQGGL